MYLRQVRELSVPAASVESIEVDDRCRGGSLVRLKCGAVFAVGESVQEVKRKLRTEERPRRGSMLQDLMAFFATDDQTGCKK